MLRNNNAIFNNFILLLCNKMPVALIFEFHDSYKLNHSIKLIVSYSPKFIEKTCLIFLFFSLIFRIISRSEKYYLYFRKLGEKVRAKIRK